MNIKSLLKRLFRKKGREEKKHIPPVKSDAPCLFFDLRTDEPDRTTEGFLYFDNGKIDVYRDGEKTASYEGVSAKELEIRNGVGCLTLLFRREGNPTVLCRARASERRTFADFVKTLCRAEAEKTKDAGENPPVPTASGASGKKKGAFLRLLGMARPEYGYIALSAVFYFLNIGVQLVLPYTKKLLVDDYINKNDPDVTTAFVIGFLEMLFAYFLCMVVVRLFHMIRGCILAVGGNNLVVRIRDTVFSKIQKLSLQKVSEINTGELMKRVNHDSARVKNFLISNLPDVLEELLLFIAVSGFMIVYDWRLALMIILPMPLVVLIFRFVTKFLQRMSKRQRQMAGESDAILHDTFSGIREVKAYGNEAREEAKFVRMAAEEKRARMREEHLMAVLMPLVLFLLGFGEYILLYYVGNQMLAGSMTAGDMTQFTSYTTLLFTPLATLVRFPTVYINTKISLSRIFDVLDEPQAFIEGEHAPDETFRSSVDVDHITFGYRPGETVLKDVDLHIAPGEFIGIVGASGSGKSTLINLIMRMYDVDGGEIRIDGHNIKDYSQESLRSFIGVVLQDNFLFAGTVAQNIAYSKPGATHAEIVRAAKLSGAHDFIIRLPDGYDTYVGEHGHTLSGGERQRLAIARALLHDPKILILDEATASLDTETEKLIQDALQNLSAGRTTIAIAHRLSTLRNATRLVVLDKKTVAEVGTHEELMAKEGIYYRLVNAQKEMNTANEK